MFKSILEQAENIGKHLAKNKPQTIHSTSTEIPVTSIENGDDIIFQIKPFRENEFGTEYWLGFLKNFISGGSDSISFITHGNRTQLKFYVSIPSKLKIYTDNVFSSSFPTSDLIETAIQLPKPEEYITFDDKSLIADDTDFTKNGTYLDPFVNVLSLYDSVPKDESLTLHYTFVSKIEKGFWEKFNDFLIKFFQRPLQEKKEDNKKEEPIIKIESNIAVGYAINIKDKFTSDSLKSNIKAVFSKYLKEGKIEITPVPKHKGITLHQAVHFFHLPTRENFVKSLDYSVYRKLPYPQILATPENTDKDDLTLLGTTEYKSDKITFGIKMEDKFRHMYVVGKSGTGKSTFLSNLIKNDIINNKGLALIDPHGDLVDTIMEHIPSHRINDVILFDVSDTEFPIGFNLLQANSPEEKQLIVSGVVGTFKKLFDTSRGPRLEYILRNVMLTVIEYPNATLQHILRVLLEKNFKEEVLTYVTDPVVVKFWRQEYDVRTDKFKDEAIAPITNKVGQFLSSPIVRNIFGQPMSKLNMRKIMDEGKILLINLSKGKIGEDNSAMIGSFLVTKFQIDAMARADMSFKDRKPFFLYIDEFQNFATDSFSAIFSEARKYKLSLIVANQYTSQLDERIRDAVFGNVGTIISFTLGYDDANMMALQFKEMVTANDFLSLPRFKAYIKLMTDGVISDPFSMATLPLSSPESSEEVKDKVKRQSRQRYGMERVKLEELLRAWTNKTFSVQEKLVEKAKADDLAKGGKQMTIDELKIGGIYDGYVKLKYNYGLFVSVKSVEGLLHKNFIKAPNGVERKDFYNIGDKITVKVDSFKDINGEKRVVWIM